MTDETIVEILEMLKIKPSKGGPVSLTQEVVNVALGRAVEIIRQDNSHAKIKKIEQILDDCLLDDCEVLQIIKRVVEE